MKRVSPNAAPIPITTPTTARRIPCQTTRERMRRAVGAESHADAHFLGALLDGVGHKAVDADSGQDKRAGAENGEQEHVEVLTRGGVPDDLGHGADAGDGKAAAALAQLAGNSGNIWMRIAVGTDQPDHGADVGVERGHAIGDLRAGNNHERARIVVEAAIANVADHADDLPCGLRELRADAFADEQLLPDGVLFGKEFFHEGFVDEHHAGEEPVSCSVKSRPRRMGMWKTAK